MISPSKQTKSEPRRHDFATIDPGAWRPMLRQHDIDPGDALVAAWAEEGRPLVRRRGLPGEREGVPLGLSLPPTSGKRRLSFVAQPEAVIAWAPPPLLAHVPVPEAWRSTQAAVVALGARQAAPARVFGSFAWSALTGLAYLTPTSDLDLLFPLPRDGDIAGLLRHLSEIEAMSPASIDGEIVRGDGVAVNWRELSESADEVLVKTLGGVALRSRSWFLDEERL